MDTEVMDVAIHAALENVHTILPGRVVSYAGHASRVAKVRPTVRLPMLQGPMLDIPAIGGVPVVFPSTAKGSLLFPVEEGDGVLICFSEVGIGKWLSSQVGAVADPDDMNRHSLTDAIAIPGLFPRTQIPILPTMDESKVGLGHADGAVLELGALFSLRTQNSDLKTEIEKLWKAVDTLAGILQTFKTNPVVNGSPATTSLDIVAQVIKDRAGWSTDKAALGQVLA